MSTTTTSASSPISLKDLLHSTDYFSHLETTNKQVFNNLDYQVLKINLVTWVGKGCPDAYTVFTFPVVGITENGLYKCSDCTIRELEDYAKFFLNMDISELIASYQSKLGGIKLSYSVGEKCINLLATKPSKPSE